MDVTDEFNVATGVRIVTEDHGDGTGTRTTYDDGNVAGVEQLTGLPIQEDDLHMVDPAAALLGAAEQARRDAYDATLAGKTRTLALLDQAQRAGSAAFSAALE